MRVEAMQTLQFSCPLCTSLMAVGLNLLGRNVRCPHCKQVVQAPASNPSEAETPRPAPVPEPAPVPVFQIPAPPKETHESIFGENHSDDLFEGATRTPRPIMPDVPVPPPSRLEIVAPPRDPETVVELPNPVVPASPFDFARPEPLRPPVIVPPVSEPDPEPLTFAANQVKESGGSRPPLAPETVAAPQPSSTLLMIILAYAGLVTAVAAYLFFTSKTSPKGGEADPHWAVPDLFGEYDKAERKRVSASFFPPALGKLPPQLVTSLKKPIRVGDLEVEPLAVKFETPQAFERGESGVAGKPIALKAKVLSLELRVTNRSADTQFHPNDPAFQRRTAHDNALNAVEVGDKHEFGGLFSWPQQGRRYVAGQEDDAKPLPPGGSRVTVVTSATQAPYDWLKTGGKGLWRVQLRRGLVNAGDREVSATTVVGVEFSAADVKAGS